MGLNVNVNGVVSVPESMVLILNRIDNSLDPTECLNRMVTVSDSMVQCSFRLDIILLVVHRYKNVDYRNNLDTRIDGY